jgi:MinD superfamily P-loop ATPase
VSQIPVIDEEKCIGCGVCEKECSFNAIEIVEKKAKINLSLCTGCGMCITICPKNAISFPQALYKKTYFYRAAVKEFSRGKGKGKGFNRRRGRNRRFL